MNGQELLYSYDISSSKPSREPVLYGEKDLIRDIVMDDITVSFKINDLNPTATIGLAISKVVDRDMTGRLVTNIVPMKSPEQPLDEMRRLPDNWNGYGSAAPNSIAFRTVEDVLFILHQMDFWPTQLEPSAEEGISLSFHSADKYAILECYNDGKICAAIYESDQEPQVWEVGNSIEEIRLSLDQINEFVNSS